MGESSTPSKGVSTTSTDCSAVTKLCILGELTNQHVDKITQIAQKQNLSVIRSESPENYESESGILFITNKFYGPTFERLRSSHFILGPIAFLQIVQKFGKIPSKSTQPLYCLTLFEQKICVIGYKKPQLLYLKNLINFMGGSVKPSVKSGISYMVTSSTDDEQYQKAVEMKIPVRRTQWVLEIWNRRNESDFNLSDSSLENLSVTDLSGVHICFHGFCKETTCKLEEQASSIGASVVPLSSQLCTHVVVNSERASLRPIPQECQDSQCVTVVLQWFTLLCRMKILIPVDEYRYSKPENNKRRKSSSLKRRLPRPHSCSESEAGHENLEADPCPLPAVDVPQTPCSDTDREVDIPTKTCRVQLDFRNEVSESSRQLLEPPERLPCKGEGTIEKELISEEKLKRKAERRKLKCQELYETEKNYVDILNAINKIFKEPLEKMIEGKQLLIPEQDLKTIFQRFSPILKVHEKILFDLEPVVKNWKDDCKIGDIFVKYNLELTKAYPQFINYTDVILQKIEEISSSNPDFHKFLKEAESHPSCQRQGLKDLIVWPMQRIGRLVLLLQGILSDTSGEHCDQEPLQMAISMMEACGRLVNEDKRKTECVVNKLEMFYEIENCPHEFLKMKQFFVAKYVVQEVQHSEATFRKPVTVIFLLFKDFLEICKRRAKGITGLIQKRLPYKHVCMLPLSCIKNVVLITSPKEHVGKFAIMVQPVNGVAYCSVYSVSTDDAQDLVYNLSVVTAKHTFKSIDEIRKDMSFGGVLNFFTGKDTAAKKPVENVIGPPAASGLTSSEDCNPCKNKGSAGEKSSSGAFVFQTPEKHVGVVEGCLKSPSSKSLPSSQKKGKLRRAFSSFLTPIQNIVTPSSPGSPLKSGISATSINSLEGCVPVPSDPPVIRRKLKSNSFGAKPSKPEFH